MVELAAQNGTKNNPMNPFLDSISSTIFLFSLQEMISTSYFLSDALGILRISRYAHREALVIPMLCLWVYWRCMYRMSHFMVASLQVKIWAFAFVQYPDIVWHLYEEAYGGRILILPVLYINMNCRNIKLHCWKDASSLLWRVYTYKLFLKISIYHISCYGKSTNHHSILILCQVYFFEY